MHDIELHGDAVAFVLTKVGDRVEFDIFTGDESSWDVLEARQHLSRGIELFVNSKEGR